MKNLIDLEVLCDVLGRFPNFTEFRNLKLRMKGSEVPGIVDLCDLDEMLLVYADLYIIEEMPSMNYVLRIGRCSWQEQNLDVLEAKLFIFACESYVDSQYAQSAYAESLKVRVQYNILDNAWYY